MEPREDDIMAHDEAKAPDVDVVLHDAPRANLLALLVRGLLVAGVTDPALARRARGLRGEVEVAAGRMVATLAFEGARVVVRSGPAQAPRARVSGDVTALLDVVARRALAQPVLAGRVRLGGNLAFLLRVLPLVRSR